MVPGFTSATTRLRRRSSGLIDDPRTSEPVRQHLRHVATGLDPVRLLRDIRSMQQKLMALADAAGCAPLTETSPLPLDTFLSSLRTLWQNGEARPTATDKPPQKRGGGGLIHLVLVADQLETWFAEEPWRTARELLDKLQTEQPGKYPDSLLRTLQRRLKGWRTDQARALVFSHTGAAVNNADVGSGGISVAV